MGLCSGHGHFVVIRELSLYPQSLLAKLTVEKFRDFTTPWRIVYVGHMYMSGKSSAQAA